MTALNAGDNQSKYRMYYLRGDRTLENTYGGRFRARTGILGDIADSSPTWSGPPAAFYGDKWSDLLTPVASPAENGGQTYSAYLKAKAKRLNVVFVGANDGLLHGFEAGSYDGTGTGGPGDFGNFVNAQNDGKEVLAYLPDAAAQTIHNATTPALDFSGPRYAHNYFVDATPAVGDLFYGGTWHTWLAGGMGPGGNAVFALDVTDPTQFNEVNAAKLVIGEWSSTSISCANVSNCGQYLGQTYGTPQIRRLHNGTWAILFGNGLHSAQGHAGMFVMLVGTTGTITSTYFLDTGAGSPTNNNGITTVTPVDLDGDHVTDFVYAGDLLGNVWRFDLTAASATGWRTSPSTPIFAGSASQPISTQVQATEVPSSAGAPRVLIEFGTGLATPQTLSSPVTYASGSQAIYGVWDSNFTQWNTQSSALVAALPSSAPVTVADLQQQTVTASQNGGALGLGSRTVSTNPICWAGTTGCSQKGFVLTLPGQGEQVIYSGLEVSGVFVVNTLVPADTNPLSCSSSAPTGWTMALDASNGGALPSSFFANAQNQPSTLSGVPVSGVRVDATGTGFLIPTAGGTVLVNQNVGGSGSALKVNPPGISGGARVTWVQVR